MLIAGATDNGTTVYYTIALRIDESSGSIIGSPLVKDGSGMNDAAVSIIEDSSGNIFMAGNTETIIWLSDYWIVKCSSSLSFINSARYDYAVLMDVVL